MNPVKKCVRFVTPFGNYKYNCLPMGISQAPDILQEIMEDMFRNFNEVDVYMDNVGVFSKDWDTHRKSLFCVLNVLETNGFTVNPAKCKWAVQETDWLGYWFRYSIDKCHVHHMLHVSQWINDHPWCAQF
jgi:Reverse transcriptase (RNA-dependent DNA polymerase)